MSAFQQGDLSLNSGKTFSFPDEQIELSKWKLDTEKSGNDVKHILCAFKSQSI
jgi:hypothetical protein